MVLVNKDEALAIRRDFPDLPLTRTCKQKSDRHRYYVPETTGALKLIKELRTKNVVTLRVEKGKERKNFV